MRKSTMQTRLKKAVTSLAVLLVFMLPLVLGVQWMAQVIAGNDPRETFSQEEIAAFPNGADCPTQADGAVKPFEEPLISVTFDDGWETTYSSGFPALESCGIKATHYILGGHFDDPLYLSEAQVRSMQSAGHEIASHTMTHPDLTTLSEETLAWEVGESDASLSQKFGTMREFATPLGASNDIVLKHIKQHYRSHRNTVGDPATVEDADINVPETFDIYNINAYTVRNTTTPEELKRLIDYTIQRKGWLVITYHQVEKSQSNYAVTQEALESQMRLIRQTGIRTATMGQVLDAIEQRN